MFVYAAGGYYAPEKGLRELKDEMRGFLDQGYRVVKMKIGGANLAEDLERIEAVLEVLDGDGSRLAVDVNGRFDLDTALEYGRAIEPYGLFWYEEVGDPLDYRLNATLAEHYSGRLATGENLFSLQDARNLIRYGGLRPDRDIIQIDPALSYGWWSTSGSRTCCGRMAGPRVAASRTAATSSPCTSPPPSSSAATSPTRESSSRPGVSPTTPSCATAASDSPISPVSASKGNTPSIRCCASFTRDARIPAPYHRRAARRLTGDTAQDWHTFGR